MNEVHARSFNAANMEGVVDKGGHRGGGRHTPAGGGAVQYDLPVHTVTKK